MTSHNHFATQPSVFPLEQVPVLSAVHGLCSKASFLGCTELNTSAPSEAFFPAEGSSCQRLEHDAAISE